MIAQKLKAPALSANNSEGVNIAQLEQEDHSTKARLTILSINFRYRITGNVSSWNVEIRRKRGNQLSWQAVTYHRTLDDAAVSLWERWVRTSGAQGIAEILEVQKHARAKIRQAIKGFHSREDEE